MATRQRKSGQARRVERLVCPETDHRQGDPRHEESREPEDGERLRRIRMTTADRQRHESAQSNRKREGCPENETKGALPAAAESVAQKPQLEPDEDPNHPSSLVSRSRAPTRRTNASSKLPSPRTSSSGPSATMRPACTTAMRSHKRSTISMT